MDAPQPSKKALSVAEANALLPSVSTSILRLRHIRREIEAAEAGQAGEALEAFQDAVRELEVLGAYVKDLDAGLVDFYTLRDGKVVFLCWKAGEPRIGFWHMLEDGFAGRQPLEGSEG